MTWKLPAVVVALATMLASCDSPPKVEIVNGADAAVAVNHVGRPPTLLHSYDADAQVRIAPGATGRFILPWQWVSGEIQPSVEFKACEYRYQLPQSGRLFGTPPLDGGIGQWSGLQFASDGSIYAREKHPTGISTLAELSSRQPRGWPVRPAHKTCR